MTNPYRQSPASIHPSIPETSGGKGRETSVPESSQPPAQILIVEDEAKLASLMRDYLAQAGFATHLIADGLAVVPWLRQHPADLMILDLMLPGMDGVAICRAVREFSDLPILMATARVAEEDRLRGLGLGADDYLCKPFSLRELVARVQAILRRSGRRSAAPLSTQEAQDAAPVLHLREDRYEALLRGQRLDLTVVEFKLLLTLASHPGRVFSREHLMQHIYSEYRVVSDRTIDSHIKKLRHKMRAAAPDLDLIHSLYGAGYRYAEPPKESARQITELPED